MKVLVGIGNPGARYEGTRHNTGFRVLDRIAEREGCRIERRRFQSLVGEIRVDDEPVLLVSPQTYVNLSGGAVREALEYYRLGPEGLLVIVDDAALPASRLRFRREGSSGGHKGLAAVIDHLGTEDFARLRIGVGAADGRDLADHVLSGFGPGERESMAAAEERAAAAALEWVRKGIEACMNLYNAPQDDVADGERADVRRSP